MTNRSLRKGPAISHFPHFQQLARLLAIESQAESQRLLERRRRSRDGDAERSGESLLDMAVADHHIGLAGRTLLTFVKRNRTLRMPWHRLRVGSPVVISPQEGDEQAAYQGVVSRRNDDSIQIALSAWPAGDAFRIDLSPDEVTRQRQLQAIQTVANATGRLSTLRRTVMGEREPKFHRQPIATFFADLNESQQQAVRFALSASDIAVIHGPPGTGKTTTVVEIIRQAVALGHKVLACAPSNTATDNLLERLAAAGLNVVRLGHPARVTEELRDLTLDHQVESHDHMSIIIDMIREADDLLRQANRFTRAKPQRGAKQELRREAKRLKSDARRLERQAVEHILDSSDVVCTTTTVDAELLGDRLFDLIVIDEACQSTEPGTWVPMLHGYRVVLAGDHCQLPPTVISPQAAAEGLSVSLLESVVQRYGAAVTSPLDIQYRMHQHIMDFSSREFYAGSLIADTLVIGHSLSDLPHVRSTPLTSTPVTFIDTAGAGWEEELEPDGESRRNPSEAALVLNKVNELRDAGLPAADIGVIAPYAAQVRLLRDLADMANLEIDTVDGFQGREKEAIVISLVRSNPACEIGFLADTRRMNVRADACTSQIDRYR